VFAASKLFLFFYCYLHLQTDRRIGIKGGRFDSAPVELYVSGYNMISFFQVLTLSKTARAARWCDAWTFSFIFQPRNYIERDEGRLLYFLYDDDL